jgi:CheY-like chemotaxis protein
VDVVPTDEILLRIAPEQSEGKGSGGGANTGNRARGSNCHSNSHIQLANACGAPVKQGHGAVPVSVPAAVPALPDEDHAPTSPHQRLEFPGIQGLELKHLVDLDPIQLQPSKVRTSVKALTMWVVDDEVLNRMVMVNKLRQAESSITQALVASTVPATLLGGAVQCAQAENAEDALMQIRGRLETQELQQDDGEAGVDHRSIILLDEHMQGSGGLLTGSDAIPLFRGLVEKYGGVQPVIVICSGNCAEQDQTTYISKGADAVWPKPFPSLAQMSSDIVEWLTKMDNGK